MLQNPYAVTQMDPSADILAAYLKKEWGITLRNDIIIDLINRYILNPFASTYPSGSPITERIPANMISFFPTAMSLRGRIRPKARPWLRSRFVQIDAAKDQAWGETDLASVGLISFLSEAKTATFDKEKDNASPLNVGVAAEDALISSRVVVFGDEDFAENQVINQGAGANSDLIVNAVDWASQQENLISLTPKESAYRFISLPQDAWVMNAIVLTSACLLPGSFLLLYGHRLVQPPETPVITHVTSACSSRGQFRNEEKPMDRRITYGLLIALVVLIALAGLLDSNILQPAPTEARIRHAHPRAALVGRRRQHQPDPDRGPQERHARGSPEERPGHLAGDGHPVGRSGSDRGGHRRLTAHWPSCSSTGLRR